MKIWQLQEAKARFSQVVKLAQEQGPQQVSVHGEATAIVLSIADYRRLAHAKPSFVELMRASPLAGANLKTKRIKDPIRTVEL